MEASKRTGGELAATWRNQAGEIVGSTFGGTMCWRPRKPWSLRIERDGDLMTVRCGECPGCMEFDRRRLADRLHAKYGASDPAGARSRDTTNAPGAHAPAAVIGTLYLHRIYAPRERHAALARKLRRRRGIELEPGFIRLGATSFAVIAHVKVLPPLYLGGVRVETRTETILLGRGRRAWRSATAGMVVAREVYGEQTNRFYIRGLPAAERQSWNVLTHAGAKGYSRARDPRVWQSANLVLVPPEVWSLRRDDRRTVRRDLGRASSPGEVARVMAAVRALAARTSQSLLPVSDKRGVLTMAQVKEHYARMAKRKKAGDVSPPPSNHPPLSLREGGYISSIRTTGAGPPDPKPPAADFIDMSPWRPLHFEALPEDALIDLTHKQMLHRRTRKLLDAQLDRFHKRLKGA